MSAIVLQNLHKATAELHEARAELAQIRAYAEALNARCIADTDDAERYRWLRDQHWSRAPLAVVRDPKDAVKLGHELPSGSRLDEAIDAAMSVQRCSSLCAPGEPCSVTADGKCDAVAKPNYGPVLPMDKSTPVRWGDGLSITVEKWPDL
jgi:hypothetical protein